MAPLDRKPPALDVLDDTLLKQIGERGDVRAYPPNAILINEGDRSDTFFIILSGRVKVFGSDADGNHVIYVTHGAGEYVGEMSLDGGPRTASVMTLEKTTCAVVSGKHLREFITAHPDFALNLIHKLIRRARLATLGMKNLALLDVYGRICALLMSLGQSDGTSDAGKLTLGEKLTQQSIAERVGASREMVSRILKDLVAGGYVENEGGRITILRKLPERW